jgi:hypothetical protein
MDMIGLLDLLYIPANIVELRRIIRGQGVYAFIRHAGPGVNGSGIEIDKAVIADRLFQLFYNYLFGGKAKMGVLPFYTFIY